MKESNVIYLFSALPYPLGFRDPKVDIEQINLFSKDFNKNFFLDNLTLGINYV